MGELIRIHQLVSADGHPQAVRFYWRAWCDCGRSRAVARAWPIAACACGLVPTVRPSWGPPAPPAIAKPPEPV